jgi:hypothetical protein
MKSSKSKFHRSSTRYIEPDKSNAGKVKKGLHKFVTVRAKLPSKEDHMKSSSESTGRGPGSHEQAFS